MLLFATQVKAEPMDIV